MCCLADAPDEETHERWERTRKRMRLDAEELLSGLHGSASVDTGGRGRAARLFGSATDTLMKGVGAAILSRVRVELARVHVRFEHTDPATGTRFACGLTARQFELGSLESDPHGDSAGSVGLQRRSRSRNSVTL